MNAILQVAWLTILEARRRWTFLLGILLSTLFLGGIVTLTTLAERAAQNASQMPPPEIGHDPTDPDDAQPAQPAPDKPSEGEETPQQRHRRQRFEGAMATQAIRAGGMWVIRTFAAFMAIVLAAGTVAPERESGVLHTIVTKPVRRFDVLAGKWLGLNALLFAYLLISGVLLAVVIGIRTASVPWDVTKAAVVSLLFPLLFVSVVMLFSVMTSVWVAMGFGVFAWIVGAQEYGVLRVIALGLRNIGRGPAGEVLDSAAHLAGWLVPTGRIGLLVDKMAGSQLLLVPSPITRPSATWWDAGYVLLYIALVSALAAWRFQRRDI